jgi:hypothetical protein
MRNLPYSVVLLKHLLKSWKLSKVQKPGQLEAVGVGPGLSHCAALLLAASDPSGGVSENVRVHRPFSRGRGGNEQQTKMIVASPPPDAAHRAPTATDRRHMFLQ